MIKYSEIESIFEEVGLTAVEYNIDLNTEEEIELPILVYRILDDVPFLADGVNFFKMLDIALALIDEELNFPMQKLVEQQLNKYGMVFEKNVNFDDVERLYSIAYSFTVMEDYNGLDNS